MLIKNLLFILFLISSVVIFFINNLFIITTIIIIELLVCTVFKIKIPIIKTFIIFLIINFLLNYWLSNINNAVLVSMRLLIMFIMINIINQKIGINKIGYIIGNIIKDEEITLIILITLNFIPIMIKETSEIKKSLIAKNYSFNIINLLRNPMVFVTTFINNIFIKIKELEKVLIARGFE